MSIHLCIVAVENNKTYNKLMIMKQLEIVTSYFAQAKNLRANGYIVSSISLYSPRFVSCISYRPLAPPAEPLRHWKQNSDRRLYTIVFNSGRKSELKNILLHLIIFLKRKLLERFSTT